MLPFLLILILRKTSSMKDSTAMTIEFLRVRLLSERSISRSARQRADELAKKVMELEEQLRMVTLQRKMAEKATSDVLAILENQGISDVSKEFDLGSDLEIPWKSGVSNDSAKEGERSTSSRGRRHRLDELSGSDVDSSPVSCRSLSWRGHLDSPHSNEQYKTSNLRRQSSFTSISSSPKHLGKSRRKIRHRQTRSVAEEPSDKSVRVNRHENEIVSSSEGFPNCSDGGPNILRIESKIQQEDELEVNEANKNHHVDGYGREKDMEMALEHRAQLIDQYGAMEKAQREWEEKYRENNNTTQDSCDPGNHSDGAEEKDARKAQVPCSAKVVASNAEQYEVEPRGVSLYEEKFESEVRDNMSKSYDDTGGQNNRKSTTFSTSGLPGQENSNSLVKENQNESSVNCHQNEPYASDCHEQSHRFSGLLESLKQARISLQQELNNRLPLVEDGYTGKAIKPSVSVSKSEDRFDIRVGRSGLFRLPTDFSAQTAVRFNVHESTSRFSSNFYLDRGISRTSGGQFFTNPYSGSMLSSSADDQSLATPYLENGSRSDIEKSPFDSFSNGGLPSSGKYMYPTFPIYPSYQNATTQMPFGDEISRPYSSSTVGVPLPNNISFHGDHLRPNMYI